MQSDQVDVWLEALEERGLLAGVSERLLASEVSLLAVQVDAAPGNAALWGQYRAARAELQEVVTAHDDGSIGDLLERLRGSEVGDTAEG